MATKIIDNGDGTRTSIWGKDDCMSHTWKVPTQDYTARELTPEMVGKWIKIGEVGVDSGMLMITDPCYEADYENIMATSWATDHASMRQIHYKAGHPGEAVAFSSGLGDGCYDVMARIEDIEGWGLRIAEIRIQFIPHPYDKDGE